MFAAILAWWRRRQRKLDVEILWPELKAQASDLAAARTAFVFHAINDSAWVEYDADDLRIFVSELH